MSDMPHKSRIADAFDRARNYDEAADVQRGVADTLARQIAQRRDGPIDSILEIGAGTGFLTQALARGIHGAPARWIVSDVAPAMVERVRESGPRHADYRVIDGEAIDPSFGRFDLICSSLAFQWFADLPRAVSAMQAMLNPGGMLAFATMARGSFAEWQAAHQAEGLASGTPAYPDEKAFKAMAARGAAADIEIVEVPHAEADAMSFLRGLKTIGAGTPRAGRPPLDPASLRRVMAWFDAGERIVTYRIAFCLFRRPPLR